MRTSVHPAVLPLVQPIVAACVRGVEGALSGARRRQWSWPASSAWPRTGGAS